MSGFVSLLFCSIFSQFPGWVWSCLSMFLVFLLLPLASVYLLRKSIWVETSSSSVSRDDDESSEGVLDTETSSSSTHDESSEVVVDSKASSSSTDEYDVFLSFRGPDTRQGITNVLYKTMKSAGILVFKDDDEVSIGQPLQKILHAIETSQICIPIFSRGFAESSWCLREVARMIELKKVVMPIFYDVTPNDVKLKTEVYRNDLKMHTKNHSKEKVKKWEDALKEVSRIKGNEVHRTGYTEFCKKFVNEGLSKFKPRKRSSYDESLIGIDRQINYVINLMDMGSPDVRYIAIHGMGGIGKTTLAKAVFETLLERSIDFESSYFLRNVRESSLRCNDPQDLRTQLQAGLDPEFSKGINSMRSIEERFKNKKVLIVLDDVDKSKIVQELTGKPNGSWFGSGSRIIVTTRNVDVMKIYTKLVRFEMMPLKPGLALELFKRHAFREEKPPSILETISKEIVSTVGGLPLALEVMGSQLYDIKDERIWRDVLERSREVQDKDVKETLRISYDALDPDQKKIFLDIACIPGMEDKVKSVSMWEASKLYPHLNLGVLCSMSLLKMKDDKIWMHDVLRDLGKNIASEEHSRVWKNEEAINVLLNKEGHEKVEVFSVDEPLELPLSSENLANFRELRVLKLVGNIDFEGDFQIFLPKLRWLTWKYCPQSLNIINLYMKNLVILNLSNNFIDESWGGWSMIKNLNHLKDLDLSYSHNLIRTPDFSETNCLEILTLVGCGELREIHGSVGKLRRLKYLNLEDCCSLGGLPDEIGRLVNLEKLRATRPFQRGESLITFKLPETVGNLKSLVVLELISLEITDLPNSIGGLVKLKRMSLHTSAKVLPESLGDLKSLDELVLNAKRISKLPNSLGNLEKLRLLRLQKCSNLEELPESLGSLQELKRLYIIGANKIRKIPVSIGKLKRLQEFEFSSIGGMLDELPTELFCASGLRSLTLKGSSVSTLPFTIIQLPRLHTLTLEENHQLQELPELPLSLKFLSVSSMSLQKSPDLSRLVNLLRLRVLTMDDYRWPQQLPSFKVEGIEKLTILQELGLGVASTATNLDSLNILDNLSLDFRPNISCVSLLPSLDILEGNSETSKVGLKLPNLSGLKYLSRLRLQNCLIEDGELIKSLGIQHLGNVKRVFIENCGFKLIEQTCLMKNLKDFAVTSCGSLKTLPNLADLKNLKILLIHNCTELVEIPGLENLESLVSLDISDCGSLERLENLSKLKKLSRISLSNCPKLRILEVTERFSFEYLDIENCGSLQNVEELKKNSVSGCIDGVEYDQS